MRFRPYPLGHAPSVKTLFAERDLETVLTDHWKLFDITEATEARAKIGASARFAQERIYNLVLYDGSGNVLHVDATTGTMAKALQNDVYKDRFPRQRPVLVQGMVFSDDGYLVMGVRSKPKFRAHLPDEPLDFKVMFSPAGYASLFARTNEEDAAAEVEEEPQILTLEQNFFKELGEELGLTPGDLKSYHMAGHHHDTLWTNGFRITFVAESGLAYGEIQDKWASAPNGWEYEHLVRVKRDPAAVQAFLTMNFPHDATGQATGLNEGVLRPPLEYYVAHEGRM